LQRIDSYSNIKDVEKIHATADKSVQNATHWQNFFRLVVTSAALAAELQTERCETKLCKWRWQMANELAGMIKADLAALNNAAAGLSQHAASIAPAAQFSAGHQANNASFSQSMADAIHGVNAADRAAAEKMADVDAGRSDDLVGAMLSSQEASLSFSMLMQVRNKVMGAVEDLIKLPL
jgi:flagellar hook-basal body complex protein FliE